MSQETIKSAIKLLRPKIDTIKATVDRIQPRVETIKSTVDRLHPQFDTIKSEMQRVLENRLLPRSTEGTGYLNANPVTEVPVVPSREEQLERALATQKRRNEVLENRNRRLHLEVESLLAEKERVCIRTEAPYMGGWYLD